MKNLIASETEGFIKVCSLDDLEENIGRRYYIEDTDIAIYKLRGEVFAVNNVCPHQRSALMYDGFIEDGHVVCPVHGWMFNLKTGRTPAGVGRLDIYETIVKDNDIYVKVYSKNYNW